MHHDEHSHNPPYSALEVFGAAPTPALREALGEFGFTDIAPSVGSFRASRPSNAAVAKA